MRHAFLPLALAAVLAASCRSAPAARTWTVEPGADAQSRAQAALIKARPGDTVQFGPGTFELTLGLSLAVPGVTVRGAGMERTVLSFRGQEAGSEGLLVTSDRFTLEDLTVADTKGDGVKVSGADGVTLRRVAAVWTAGPRESNGGYGLYPVQCRNVLIEDSRASGASDAGIYVGQSENVVIRGCRAEKNVAGIEVENSTGVDVHDNVSVGNTGGLLVFDLPDLPVKRGGRVRVFANTVESNNHPNFAPRGNIVALVPPGTGIMVMAADQVEVFGNTVRGNDTASLAVVSYHITARPVKDPAYDPYPEAVYVHDNTFADGGRRPAGELGALLAAVAGVPVPDIVYDGIVDPRKAVEGRLPPALRLHLRNNGEATFANLRWASLDPARPAEAARRVLRDPLAYAGELPPLPAVVLPGAPGGLGAAGSAKTAP